MRSVHTLLVLCFCALGCCLPGRSQALPAASGPGSYVSVGGGLSAFQADYGRNKLGGGFAFVDTHPDWRWGLEGEGRWLRWHSPQHVAESSYLGGVRVVLWPRPRAWQPYAKFLAGAGHITLPYGYAQGTFLTYAPGAGVDITVNDRVALRALDVEYQHWPAFPYGSLSPYGVSAGIIVRLNGVPRFPKGARARH